MEKTIDGVIYTATMELRYAVEVTNGYYVLQQKFISSLGNESWVEVPKVFEN